MGGGAPGRATDRAKTRVYVTVDVECAEERVVGGKIRPPLGYDLRVWGRFANHREELGIGLLMGELERHGFRGTFFLEPLGAPHFGVAGLRDIVTSLRGRGHDVQLHTHPIQENPTFRTRGEEPAADDIGAYPVDVQAGLLRKGMDFLVAAGVPKKELLAFRAGNFGADNETWAAMERVGLRVSSNYNPCYFGKNCKMRVPHPSPGLFESPVRGVWELPVTCFREAGPARYPFRHLQIAAASVAETIRCLEASRALGINEVTLVTHSFELYVIDSPEARKGHVNSVNLGRLQGILGYLAANRAAFEVETVGALAQRITSGDLPVSARRTAAGVDGQAAVTPPYPEGHLADRAMRFVEQGFKRLAARVR